MQINPLMESKKGTFKGNIRTQTIFIEIVEVLAVGWVWFFLVNRLGSLPSAALEHLNCKGAEKILSLYRSIKSIHTCI